MVAGTSMENYWNNGNAVAFSRGNKGFFAMAKQGSMSETLQTGRLLPLRFQIPRRLLLMLLILGMKVYLLVATATLSMIAHHRSK